MKHIKKVKMNKVLAYLGMALLIISCADLSKKEGVKVTNAEELQSAIAEAQAGTEIIMANGIWENLQIEFSGKGTEQAPIVLKAETKGEVIISGKSSLKFGGDYLSVEGLYFKNGYTPDDAVVRFKIDNQRIGYHCTLSNCVIEDFSNPDKRHKDHWVEFWGRHNQLDHCYIAGKANEGPTIRVYLKGNEHMYNYHQIVNNHFGPRPRKGGPKAETIQCGDSYSSMNPSYAKVANNLFERCNGEVEIISNKSNFNEYRNNVFFECEGSLVLRHGNFCTIDGNFFIGNDNNDFAGGVRLINGGHWITNNYFYKIKGNEFRSPLAIMNGVPKSPMNRYNQVTDAVVAYNTWVDCPSPWQISVGANMSQSDVLPPSEIRSARPTRTIVANNIIFNHNQDALPVKAYDKVDGILFTNNLINNQGETNIPYEGIASAELSMDEKAPWLFVPAQGQDDVLSNVYNGFEFDKITNDIFGNSRLNAPIIGAVTQATTNPESILDKSLYGTDWFTQKVTGQGTEIKVSAGELKTSLLEAKEGDILVLTDELYELNESLVIDKIITIQSEDKAKKAVIKYNGAAQSPAFLMYPKGDLTLDNVVVKGSKAQYAMATRKMDMAGPYYLDIKNTTFEDFAYVLKAYKSSFADSITFRGSEILNCENGIDLSAEIDDLGDYNVEVLTIENCNFSNVKSNVINFYRGGYDESTIGGVFKLNNCSFTACGAKEATGTLVKSRGIVNVDIYNNTFKNNQVKLVALLWGAKNNNYGDNIIENSGKIVVEDNLKLKLVY
jgi:poly(beta-D-mannuronate) lyase